MPIGKIETFEVGTHNWDAYCRRIQQFIALNNIATELHVATLITHVGVTCYELMCDLCAPNLPELKSFNDLVRIMREHLEPQRSEIAERHIFRQRKQMAGETVSEFLQSLKHLAKTCNFNNTLEENLRDQFVSGLHNEDMRSRLFVEKDLKYSRAIELALSLEAADRDALTAVQGGGAGIAEGVHRVTATAPRRAADGRPASSAGAGASGTSGSMQHRPCPRCGRTGHAASRCRFKVFNCDKCGEKGHLKVMCRKFDGEGESQVKQTKGQFFLSNSDSEDEVNFYSLSCDSSDNPYYITLSVGGHSIRFEVDTGCKFSVISKSVYDKLFSNLKLNKKILILKSYTGNVIEPLGYIMVNVSYHNKSQLLQLYVIDNGGPPLLGRMWIRMLEINVNDCFSLSDYRCDQSIKCLLNEFPDVFADGLGTCNVRMQLHLSDTTPIFVKARPLPLALRDRVERELERLQRDDVIFKVDRSDYGTPIVPVIKKNGDIRICGDYKTTINSRLKDFHYPLPRIEEIFATLAGGVVFSKLDLSHAYQQVLLTEDSQPMTAITTHVGTFVYKRVPFGIKCIPENFQKIIEETLSGLPFTVVFQDDICVGGKSYLNNLENLRAVLLRLKSAGLRVNWSKCEFFKDSVSYLGYRIDKEGLHADEKKIEAIKSAPIPQDITQLKSFLGLVNFYSKFCTNLSDILKPLYCLLKKDCKWFWSKDCELAFNKIKSVLSSSPVLAHYDPNLPLILSVDSSAYGVGAVLLHRFKDGTERAISCASRTLNEHERNYSQLDKEALAIVYGVTKHHQYLYGRHFLLRSDHRALSFIFGKNKGIPQTAASRLQRYAVRLAAYNFDIEFVPSARNCFADALSRLPLQYLRNCTDSLNKDLLTGSYLNFIENNLPVTFNEIKKETMKDTLLNKIVGYIKFGWPDHVDNDTEKVYFQKRDSLFIEHGCLVWGYRVVIPSTLRKRILSELHCGHIGIVKMKQVSRNYLWWEGLDADIERICRECSACASQRDNPPHAPLHVWPWPLEPWTRLNIDFLGPYKNRYYLIIIDANTKWMEVESVTTTSAQVVISCLRKIFSRFGLPKCIVSDNGPPFSSKDYLTYLEKNGIKRVLVAPYHPSSNGAAENAVRLIKQVLKKATIDGENYETAICRFLFAYRNAEHCTTQKEPAVAMLGRRLRGRLDLIRPSTAAVVQQKQSLQEAYAGGVPRDFIPGEQILVRNYNDKDVKWKTGTILDRTGPVSYKVKTNDNNQVTKRHVDQLISHRKSRYSLPCTEESNDDGWLTPTDQSPTSEKLPSPVNIGSDEGEVDVVDESRDHTDESFHIPNERQHQNYTPLKMKLRPRVTK